MTKEYLLKQIAEAGYNVGFGAKKHFATYDIVEKTPGLIGFSSMAIGILGLVFECLSTKGLSALFLVMGIAGFYIDRYNDTKDQFMTKAEELTRIFNDLKVLYYKVKSTESDSLEEEQAEFVTVSARYHENCFSKQILFSDWCAHYKFFWQLQIDWIDEQKHFKFWRDKVPLSFTISFLLFFSVILSLVVGSFL